MAMIKPRKHTHKYYKMPFADSYVWACGIAGCSHHIPRYMEASIRQKASVCWQCEDEFFFAENAGALMMSNPVCLSCAPDSIAKSVARDLEIQEQVAFPGHSETKPTENKRPDLLKYLKENGIK